MTPGTLSSEVNAGSREENASPRRIGALHRFRQGVRQGVHQAARERARRAGRAGRLHLRAALLALVLSPAATAGLAGETVVDDHGVLNPSDFSMDAVMRRIEEKRATNWDCIAGYEAAKAGMHAYADRIFTYCAEKGVVGALPWMAWLEENGYTHPSNPTAAAEWDRRSAEIGSSVGELNYGLDLLRGHGVERDAALGRSYIDRAAAHGDETARQLAANGYDPDAVTPDADEKRYRKPVF